MDVQEFQKKLAEICKIAEEKGNQLGVTEIRDFFQGMDLEQSQLLKVLQYLKIKGVSITGAEVPESDEEKMPERKSIPLTPEEQQYLKEYRAGFDAVPLSDTTLEDLWMEFRKGSTSAQSELVARYLPVAAELAVDMNCEEIPIADLIQEANICLLTVMDQEEPVKKSDAWLRLEIRKGIAQVIEEQTQQKYADEQLVEKVQKLEDAIRELSEDEEGTESAFSVNELAIILDMEIDEIKDILRLTGDEN